MLLCQSGFCRSQGYEGRSAHKAPDKAQATINRNNIERNAARFSCGLYLIELRIERLLFHSSLVLWLFVLVWLQIPAGQRGEERKEDLIQDLIVQAPELSLMLIFMSETAKMKILHIPAEHPVLMCYFEPPSVMWSLTDSGQTAHCTFLSCYIVLSSRGCCGTALHSTTQLHYITHTLNHYIIWFLETPDFIKAFLFSVCNTKTLWCFPLQLQSHSIKTDVPHVVS